MLEPIILLRGTVVIYAVFYYAYVLVDVSGGITEEFTWQIAFLEVLAS